MYSDKIAVAQIIEIIKAKGIRDVIISPGSRNAPFTIGFTKDTYFNCRSIVDERSAAFFAMGRALKTGMPVIVLCTSGSAILNYFPAVAEAFYQEIPLLVISADRPKSWMDQGNGQTIRQDNTLSSHCVKSLSVDGDAQSKEDLWYMQRELNFALNRLLEMPYGPVHLNVHLNEPLYGQVTKKHTPPKVITKVLPELSVPGSIKDQFVNKWNNSPKKLILLGQGIPDDQLNELIGQLAEDDSVVVFSESLSNIHHKRFFSCIDKLILLKEKDLALLKPTILVTIGGAIVSKKIKELLRTWEIEEHWNIGHKQVQQDTYQKLTHEIPFSPVVFFKQLVSEIIIQKSDYYSHFETIRVRKEVLHLEYINKCDYSDLTVFSSLFKNINKGTIIHLSNSSIVRYAQLFDHGDKYIFHANRGTSGIDGSGSTAIGYSSASIHQNILITGDISFFYDSNALWNNEVLDHFKIIVVNNAGGGIFRIIPGPETSGALESYFETAHDLNAKSLAEMHNYEYSSAAKLEDLNNNLQDFLNKPGKAIFEIFTPKENNDKALKGLFSSLKAY